MRPDGTAGGRTARRRTDAEVRGEVDAGAYGDKKPGFDPAAAPMETDAESGSADAGGVMASDDHPMQWRDVRDMADSDGDAMRRMPTAKRPAMARAWPILLVILALAALAVVALSL